MQSCQPYECDDEEPQWPLAKWQARSGDSLKYAKLSTTPKVKDAYKSRGSRIKAKFNA
jgi:hypothetical protein